MTFVLALLPLLPGLAWLVFVSRGGHGEPALRRRQVTGSFLLGALMMSPAGWATLRLERIAGVPPVSVGELVAAGDIASLLVSLALITGPVEELCKWLVVRLLCFSSRDFRGPLDGMLYGAAAALGFASLENVWYLHETHGARQYALTFILRGLTAVPMHGLCGALFGYGLGKAKLGRGSSLPFLGYAAAAHGLFDMAVSVSLLAGTVALLPMSGIVYLLAQSERERARNDRGAVAAAEAPRYMFDMPIHPDLLEILACPKCKGPVKLKEDESGFVCEACRLLYPIQDDIPNFLIEEARPI